jgi:amino acid transporter
MSASPLEPESARDPPRRGRNVTLLALVAATYFMVSGGPFGLEDLVASAGYDLTLVILVVTPIIWSLPTAMAVGELAAAFPEDGGYYAWVRRALGPFWGVQEAWLSLAASFFDLAIYPTLFTHYLAALWPTASQPAVAMAIGVALIALCTVQNLRGAASSGRASVFLGVLLLTPFVVLATLAYLAPPHEARAAAEPVHGAVFSALAIAMWNYMGWDNASTIASEVKDPGRTYPRTMFVSVVLVAVTYLAPMLAMRHTGLPPSLWTAGTWAEAGSLVGGSGLFVTIALAGLVSSGGMLSALVMSYSRLPLVLAKDGYLPRWLGREDAKTGAPTVALAVCGVVYSLCLGLGFKRLVQLDVVIYGASLALEFVALVMLRIKEPDVARPYKVPFGLPGAVLVGVVPMSLLVWSLFQGGDEDGAGGGIVALACAIVLIGPLLYVVKKARDRRAAAVAP